jgi:retron-type reverse transcriptase
MSIQNVTLEDIVTDSNLIEAYKQVRQNKGSAGVDGMDIVQAHDYIMENLENIRRSVLDGRYKPQPVRRVYIPKDNGKMRQLGIPTVVDYSFQQAIKQALGYTF